MCLLFVCLCCFVGNKLQTTNQKNKQHPIRTNKQTTKTVTNNSNKATATNNSKKQQKQTIRSNKQTTEQNQQQTNQTNKQQCKKDKTQNKPQTTLMDIFKQHPTTKNNKKPMEKTT